MNAIADPIAIRARVDRDRLSIVVQGGLSVGGLVETATNCAHWRALFPGAEIILSLSGTDIVTGVVEDGRLTEARLVARIAADTQAKGALRVILASCDILALCDEGLPLPPIKSDSAKTKTNNINLQIAAARNGLRHASRDHVLRVRSDLVFLDDGFVDQYEAMAALPRGPRATLTDRVMISWLYTLNPYTYERLPLHFSDWFHFGRLDDVRALWDVPYVTLADAVHYLAHPHAPGSNAAERLFNIRLADEQHLVLHALADRVPGLSLAFHNDRSCTRLAMDVLVDNFALCDLVAARTIFPKYDFEFVSADKKLHCITPEDWRLMVDNRGVDYTVTLAHKVQEALDRPGYEREEGFPRVYEAARLNSKNGRLMNREIVAESRDGVLVFGPHVSVPIGRYRAIVDATTLDGPGLVSLTATLDHGGQILAERQIGIWPGRTAELTLDFDVTAARAKDLEIVVEIEGLRSAAIRSIILEERAPTNRRFPIHYPVGCDASGTVAPVVDGADGAWRIVAAGVPLQPGRYLASPNVRQPGGCDGILMRAATGDGAVVLAEGTTGSKGCDAGLAFDVKRPGITAIDIACRAAGSGFGSVAGVTIVRSAGGPSGGNFPLFFAARQLETRTGRHENEQIVSTAKSGTLCYGPYAALPPGDYSALLLISRVRGFGKVTMTVTTGGGQARIASAATRLWRGGASRPTIAFTVDEPGAADLELVCEAAGFREIAITGLLIDRVE